MKKIFYSSIPIILLLLPFVFFSCKTDNHIGLQLYSVRDSMQTDPKGTLAKVGEIGYRYVEAAGYSSGKFYGMTPADFKAEVEKDGMIFLSSHTGQPLPDSAHWNWVMSWWDTCIDAHVTAGVKYIVQPFMGEAAYRNLDTLKMYCDYFNSVGEKCAAKGIKFGYHNHENEFKSIGDTRIYDFMLNNTDPSKVFFEMDLWWITQGGGDPVSYFDKFPGRFLIWHVKDEKELGKSGKIDFTPIFAKAQEAGVQYYIIEIEEYSMPPIESAKQSYEYLIKSNLIK